MTKTTRTQVKRQYAPRRSAAEWAAEVAAWKSSGNTALEYAQTRGVSAATLRWWSSRGGAGRTPSVATVLPTTYTTAPRAEARAFLPLHVVAPVDAEPRVEAEILLVGGRRVRVSGALTFEQLARLLQVVEGGDAC